MNMTIADVIFTVCDISVTSIDTLANLSRTLSISSDINLPFIKLTANNTHITQYKANGVHYARR
jgi:hypothetical protein